MSLDEVCSLYERTLTSLLDKHAPIIKRKKRRNNLTPWFDEQCRKVKRNARRLKRKYKKTELAVDRLKWITELKKADKIYQAKRNKYWSTTIYKFSDNPKKLWSFSTTSMEFQHHIQKSTLQLEQVSQLSLR